MLPAGAAWAAAALALGASAEHAALGAVLCAAAAGLALSAGALPRRGPATPPPTGPGRAGPGGRGSPTVRGAAGRGSGGKGPAGPTLSVSAAVALLCAAAAAGGSAALHAADLHRGPLPGLAADHARVTVEVTVTEDPHPTRPRTLGARQLAGRVVVRADARSRWSVRPAAGPGCGRRCCCWSAPSGTAARPAGSGPGPTAPGRPAVAGTRTARRGASAWLRLLPSTRLRVEADLMPPAPGGRGGRDIAAVLRVRSGPPRIVAGPTAVQRAAGALRAGLREASEGLEADARGLLPGLVVGDTSRLSPELADAFRAVDMTHLLAVSGSNLSIMLALLIGPPGLAHRAERRGLAPRLGLPLRTTAGRRRAAAGRWASSWCADRIRACCGRRPAD